MTDKYPNESNINIFVVPKHQYELFTVLRPYLNQIDEIALRIACKTINRNLPIIKTIPTKKLIHVAKLARVYGYYHLYFSSAPENPTEPCLDLGYVAYSKRDFEARCDYVLKYGLQVELHLHREIMRHGDLDFLKWLKDEQHVDFSKENLVRIGFKYNHRHILEWGIRHLNVTIEMLQENAFIMISQHQNELFFWALTIGVVWTNSFLSKAAHYGNFTLLEWSLKNHPPKKLSPKILDNIAFHGNLELLKKLSERCSFKPLSIIYSASASGFINVIEWALELTTDRRDFLNSLEPCFIATVNRKFETLKWLRSKGFAWDYRVLSFSASRKIYDIFQWATENECPKTGKVGKSADVCESLAEHGELKLLQWAVEHGYPVGKKTCSNASINGHLDILQWLRSINCPWDGNVVKIAYMNSHWDIVKWSLENGCPFVEIIDPESRDFDSDNDDDDEFEPIPFQMNHTINQRLHDTDGKLDFELDDTPDFMDKLDDTPGESSYSCISARLACDNKFELLKRLVKEYKIPVFKCTAAAAARSLNLDMLKWLIVDCKCPWDSRVYSNGLIRGYPQSNMEIAEWAFANQCPFENIYRILAIYPREEFVSKEFMDNFDKVLVYCYKWCVSKNFKCDSWSDLCTDASLRSQPKLLEWMVVEQKCEWDDLGVCKTLYDRECEITRMSFLSPNDRKSSLEQIAKIIDLAKKYNKCFGKYESDIKPKQLAKRKLSTLLNPSDSDSEASYSSLSLSDASSENNSLSDDDDSEPNTVVHMNTSFNTNESSSSDDSSSDE